MTTETRFEVGETVVFSNIPAESMREHDLDLQEGRMRRGVCGLFYKITNVDRLYGVGYIYKVDELGSWYTAEYFRKYDSRKIYRVSVTVRAENETEAIAKAKFSSPVVEEVK